MSVVIICSHDIISVVVFMHCRYIYNAKHVSLKQNSQISNSFWLNVLVSYFILSVETLESEDDNRHDTSENFVFE